MPSHAGSASLPSPAPGIGVPPPAARPKPGPAAWCWSMTPLSVLLPDAACSSALSPAPTLRNTKGGANSPWTAAGLPTYWGIVSYVASSLSAKLSLPGWRGVVLSIRSAMACARMASSSACKSSSLASDGSAATACSTRTVSFSASRAAATAAATTLGCFSPSRRSSNSSTSSAGDRVAVALESLDYDSIAAAS